MTLGNLSTQPQTPIPNLLTKEIQDIFTRKNFQSLVEYFQRQNQLVNFEFFELNITGPTSGVQTLAHELGFTPKDVIITQMTGSGSISFQFGSFTLNSISYTCTGPCRVRFFLGTYFGDTSTVAAQATDIETLLSTPVNSGVQTGTIVIFPGTTAQSGYLLCDGSTYSQATYPTLFSVVAGSNGATTFAVPNLKSIWPAGCNYSIKT